MLFFYAFFSYLQKLLWFINNEILWRINNTKVFVQNLLWFIITEIVQEKEEEGYSYKNCYGLSLFATGVNWWYYVIVQELLWFISYLVSSLSPPYWLSYKNCYGLSRSMVKDIKNNNALSYKNCYGLSLHLLQWQLPL